MIDAVLLPILAFLALPPGEGQGRPEFRHVTLVIHGRREQSIHNDFDGDGKADVLIGSIDYDKAPPERWLALHLNRGGTFAERPDHLWALSDRACVLLDGDYLPGGGAEVGFLAEDGVFVHPWGKDGPAETPVKLLHVRTFFRSPSLRHLPFWSWRLDFDANGREDLLVPLADGWRIYFQTEPGIYGKTATLESDLPAGAARTIAASRHAQRLEVAASHFVSTTELPRLEAADVNGDGLLDLLQIRGDTITYHFQTAPGVFPSRRPHRVSYAIPTLKEEEKKDTVNLSMMRFTDLDRDRVADLVVARIEGTIGLWDSIKTSIYIHMGNGRGSFIPDKRIRIDGVSIDPEFTDLNGDGTLDAVTSRLRTDLMRQAFSTFVLGDIAISYEVFQFDPKEKGFLADPVYEKRVLVAKGDLERTGKGAVPLVYIRGDLSGDGRPDLVMVDPKAQEVLIHPGRPQPSSQGPRIDFDGSPHWRLPIPKLPDALHVADVNGDGVGDVILYHSGTLGLLLSERRP